MDGAEKGNTVQNLHTGHATQNRVMAVFESSSALFELPRTATFAELAGRLAHLSEGHDGALISVDVRVSSRCAKEDKPSLQNGSAAEARRNIVAAEPAAFP